MLDYHLILAENYSNKQWAMSGNTYDGLQWLDTSPKPTQAELDALWESTQAAIAAKEQAQAQAKQSALDKLSKLGLTQDEINALIG